jgi:hypothetical protein
MKMTRREIYYLELLLDIWIHDKNDSLYCKLHEIVNNVQITTIEIEEELTEGKSAIIDVVPDSLLREGEK